MTSVNGATPRNMLLTAGLATFTEGIVLKKGSGNTLEIITAKGDAAVAVMDQSFVDMTQTAKTTVTGDRAGVFLLGSGDIVKVKSATTITYTTGCIVYLDDGVDGAINITGATSTPIGHYVGDGEATTADGDLVDVILDVSIDTATV